MDLFAKELLAIRMDEQGNKKQSKRLWKEVEEELKATYGKDCLTDKWIEEYHKRFSSRFKTK